MKSVGIEFEEIEQGMGTLSWALKDRQAKRPDFIWKEQDWLVLGDAKHHKTQCGKTFALRNMELEQYRSLEQWALDQPEVKNVLVVFLVFPNDLPPTAVPGSSLAIVGLYEMMNGVSTTLGNDPATRIDLAGKWAVWSG